jgi:hypothetical protein
MSCPLKSAPAGADDSRVTEDALNATLDDDQVIAIVGKLYGRVRDHIAAQYERQAGQCAGCGRALPTRADALIGPDGHLECVDCRLTTHRAVA